MRMNAARSGACASRAVEREADQDSQTGIDPLAEQRNTKACNCHVNRAGAHRKSHRGPDRRGAWFLLLVLMTRCIGARVERGRDELKCRMAWISIARCYGATPVVLNKGRARLADRYQDDAQLIFPAAADVHCWRNMEERAVDHLTVDHLTGAQRVPSTCTMRPFNETQKQSRPMVKI